jgi:alginate O-acetyltransferase complex protein AlgI
MLFTDPLFLLVFMPLVWAGFRALQHLQLHNLLLPWLALGSVVFYGWNNLIYVPLLLGSIGANAMLAHVIHRSEGVTRKSITGFGIALNLSVLGVFKYAAFTVDTVNAVSGMALFVPHIMLPLAISFYTFQQIAYLMDVYDRSIKPEKLVTYAAFLLFFPQLVAGPVIRYQEMVPQLKRGKSWRINAQDISVGLTLIAFGLFKKIGIADHLAPTSDAIFTLAQNGAPLDAPTAWLGALSYTAQIYFDFSGYCDIGLGLARLFAIRLPINFNSPYQATSIIDFWRRWHITLSRFLRDYLYIPLGGGRHGKARQMLNLLIVMLLGGLWHGAAWSFVLWGTAHGAALAIAHAWRSQGIRLPAITGWALTMLFVVCAWVLFRADSLAAAGQMFAAMGGMGSGRAAAFSSDAAFSTAGALAVAAIMPNALWLLRRYSPVFESMPLELAPRFFNRLRWRPTALWAFACAFFLLAVILLADRPKEFLYFQF